MLRAAELYLDQNDPGNATRVLDATPDRSLSPDYRPRRQLLEARLLLARGEPGEALAVLDTMAAPRRQASLVLATRTRIDALTQLGRNFEATLARIELDPHLTGGEARENQRAIWEALSGVPAWELDRSAAQLPPDATARGWMELASAVQSAANAAALESSVSRWRQRWPAHPAAGQLPPTAAGGYSTPRHVAVFLPLSGPLAAAGSAIRDGILAAWMAQADINEDRDDAIEASFRYALDPFASRPAGEAGDVPRISILDSARLSADALLGEASRIGADFIIGPLARERVAGLAELRPRIPVLALNYLPDGAAAPAMFTQYGLRAEDEARTLASRIHDDGRRRVLLLVAPQGWAARIAAELKERWLEPGELVAEGALGEPGKVDQVVRHLLGIDASTARAERIMRALAERPEFAPRRRQDVDAVLLVAPPTSGRIAASTLAYHYADDLPVYATSHIWNGDRTGTAIDLEGIRFCDIPWRLLDSSLAAEIIASRPDAAGPQGAFYALGIDAWHLHDRLLLLADGLRLFGATGLLAQEAEHSIRRDLMWARFENGHPRPIPISTTAGP